MKYPYWMTILTLVGVLASVSCENKDHVQDVSRSKDVSRAPNVSRAKDVPEGFQQLLPRGGIPAIDNPQYVLADKASISEGAYVFGVVIEGQPVAYSLNLLNHHEIVNDKIGKTNFAAVW
jgi:hypothetical protein